MKSKFKKISVELLKKILFSRKPNRQIRKEIWRKFSVP